MKYILLNIAVLLCCKADVILLDFSKESKETTSFRWDLTNDPVMGGQSYSNYSINEATQELIWEGTVKDVPDLDAPGFCNLMSQLKKWPDADGYSHLVITARSTINYGGFKVSFAADTLNTQFKCYKADFSMKSNGEWESIAIPFSNFSNNWSDYTGEPITSCPDDPTVCPSDDNLKDISQIGFWMEGVNGEFHFELRTVSAVNM